MAASRRRTNGRSPFVNKQSQITSFFSPGKNSPSPASIFPTQPKETPNPSPKHNLINTPSPQEKVKKPLLVIGPSNPPPANPSSGSVDYHSTTRISYSDEIVGKRIKVFWPLDDAWYEGYIKSFDELSGKHLVLYDDAEEEVLDLGAEKIEFLETTAKSFRRLRRMNSACGITTPEKENSDEERGKNGGRLRRRNPVREVKMCVEETSEEDNGKNDDSMDDDWQGDEKESGDDDSEDVEVEEDLELPESGISEQARPSAVSRKRKISAGEKSVPFKKRSRVSESTGNVNDSPVGAAAKDVKPPNSADRVVSIYFPGDISTGDAAERYSSRETEKLGFLGVKRRDAKGRWPNDANYDPRTLYLPPEFLKSLTGGQRQWWEFKSKHMDKVLFFKMGKFYELFEMDAHIGVKELDLQYMKGDQPHCGFPEKNFGANAEKLANKGYRVVVAEQTETPEQLEIRRKNGSKDKVVKREICAVVTKGTQTEGVMLSINPDASCLISITEDHQNSECQGDKTIIGLCVAEVSTSKFMFSQFEDDRERHCLSSILSELRPVEIIKPVNLLSPETERVLMRHTRDPLVNDLVPFSEFWDAEKTVDEVRNIYNKYEVQSSESADHQNTRANDDLGHLPDVLDKLVKEGNKGKHALSAFGGCLFYLRKAFLDETLLRFAKLELLQCSGLSQAFQKAYMALGSTALENLEIFENNINGGASGTLFSQLDHCVTAFGKRLLKNWLARPLYHAQSIVERQDAVASLKGQASALEFRKELCRLPDMERLLARLFRSCDANGRNANKVVLYEDASKKQLQEFIAALRGCRSMMQACNSLCSARDSDGSSVLHRLLTPGLPEICSIIKHFEDAFDWCEAHHSGRIVPHKAVDIEYDSACTALLEIESCLGKHLEEQQKLLRDKSIKYVTVGKESFLLEVPECLQGNVPSHYELRSSKKGFFRYWTPKIKKMLVELSQAEAEKESKLKGILQRLIGHFCEHHSKWRQLISTTAELDVLISLSIACDYYEGPTCRPTFRKPSTLPELSPILSAKKLGHPILRSDTLGKGSFVPNDVTLGCDGHANFVLLTGPNMGGKSTLLRQICLAVILAQVGADVPAESFELSPVDQIFVRMGAKDHIMAGQSTFLLELVETAAMLSSATRNSLVALDELGRGTSTSDGQAIAQAVLEHFVHKIECRSVFSTHYHRLAVEYEKDPKVDLHHMACQVGKGARGVEEVTFLHRLTLGACPKSYGVNVARLAGLPHSVLEKAASKSMEFESNYGKQSHEKEAALTQAILNTIAPLDSEKPITATALAELWQRSKMLVQAV